VCVSTYLPDDSRLSSAESDDEEESMDRSETD
jgi:hypothetical protein